MSRIEFPLSSQSHHDALKDSNNIIVKIKNNQVSALMPAILNPMQVHKSTMTSLALNAASGSSVNVEQQSPYPKLVSELTHFDYVY